MSGPADRGPAPVTELTAVRQQRAGNQRARDGDRWCLYCHGWLEWHAIAERWVHSDSTSPKCHPLDPTSAKVATPAPEDEPLPRIGGRVT